MRRFRSTVSITVLLLVACSSEGLVTESALSSSTTSSGWHLAPLGGGGGLGTEVRVAAGKNVAVSAQGRGSATWDLSSHGAAKIFFLPEGKDKWITQELRLADEYISDRRTFVSVAASGDGRWIAFGSSGAGTRKVEGSSALRMNEMGLVTLYERDGDKWTQRSSWERRCPAYDSYSPANSQFGVSVSLSNDGSTLAAACSGNGEGFFVFQRKNTGGWNEFSTPAAGSRLVRLSADGTRLALLWDSLDKKSYPNVSRVNLSLAKIEGTSTKVYAQRELLRSERTGSSAVNASLTDMGARATSARLGSDGVVLNIPYLKYANSAFTATNMTATFSFTAPNADEVPNALPKCVGRTTLAGADAQFLATQIFARTQKYSGGSSPDYWGDNVVTSLVTKASDCTELASTTYVSSTGYGKAYSAEASPDGRVFAASVQYRQERSGYNPVDTAVAFAFIADAPKAEPAPKTEPVPTTEPAPTTSPSTCPSESCLRISEYYEGTGNEKAIEIENRCAEAIDLSRIELCVESNANTTCKRVSLPEGSISSGHVYVVCNDSFSSKCQATSGSLSFNGNDRVALKRDGAVVDVFGELGRDPGAVWADTTFRRKSACQAYSGTGPFDVNALYTPVLPPSSDDLGVGPP